jgi:predicted PurR-regulated permease PerM
MSNPNPELPVPPAPALVPEWLIRAAAVGWRVLATAGMVVVIALVITEVPVSTTAVLVSLVFAAALAPTAIRLRNRGLPRPAAAAITFVAGAALILLAAILVIVALAGDLINVASAVTSGVESVRQGLSDIGAPPEVSDILTKVSDSLKSTITPDLSALAGAIANIGTVLVLATFLTYFLLADGDKGWAWFLRSLKSWQVETVEDGAHRGLSQVAWYIRRTAVLATLDAVVTFVLLSILGVPLAGALAAVTFVAGFVPYLGAVAGAAIVAFATLAQVGTFPAILYIVAIVATSVVSSRLLERTSMNSSVDVHPIVVLVALPVGLALFGILGLFALLPISVFVGAMARSAVAVLDLGPRTDGAPPDAGHAAAGVAATTDEADSARRKTWRDGPAEQVPVWLDRLGQWSWRLIVLATLAALAIALIVRIPGVVVPAVIAVVGAATLAPLVSRLVARNGMSRSAASALATVGTIAFIVGSCFLAINLTLGSMQDVVTSAAAGLRSFSTPELQQALLEAGSGAEVNVVRIVGDVAGLVIALVIALLMTFFFLRDGTTWWHALLARLAVGRRAPVGAAGERAVSLLAGYMIGTAAISGFGALSTGFVLWILGMPLIIPIMVISFFAGFIPYIGSFISTILATLVTVALGTTSDVIWMLIFTVVFNIVQGNIVTPIVYGKSLSLHPAIVLMAVPVGNEVAGILGMFLVVPIAGAVAATWRLVPSIIIGTGLPDEPSTEVVAVEEPPAAEDPPPAAVPQT